MRIEAGHALDRDAGASALLLRAGLRQTRQRIALTRLIFGKGHRHLSAEDLHAEALASDVRVSLATIYNTLGQYAAAGLLRQISIDSARSYYDTNVSDHFHFFVESEHRLMDMAPSCRGIAQILDPPDGYEVVSVDVIAKLRRRDA
jgi:Fur family iron response transcriptional regulator